MNWFHDLGLPIINGAILAVLGFMGGWMSTKIRKTRKKEANIEQGVLALLYDRLFQACKHHLSCNCISPAELRNLEKMYTAYQALGGNGQIEQMYTASKNLRICFDDNE